MANCKTCGTELPAERAAKYDFCTAADCQAQNNTGLSMLAVAVNKSADQYQLLDERTRAEMSRGAYRDQRRALYGRPAAARPSTPPPAENQPPDPARRRTPPPRRPWTPAQQQLALLYNARGLRPADIATRLGVPERLVTQMILAAPARRTRASATG
jgi:hypothetical protein